MTNQSLHVLVTFVILHIGRVLLIPAVGSGVWTYYAYDQMIEPMGWGLRGRFIAALGAVMASSLYYVGGYALIALVPRFGLRARLFCIPVIAAYAAMVIATSSAPQVILFHGPAREAEMHGAIEKLSRFVDGVKLAVLLAGQMGSALDDMANKGDAIADLDKRGILSGLESEGIVVATTRAKAGELRKARDTIATNMKGVEPLLKKIDDGFDRVRQAVKDSKLDFDARRLAFEKELDVIRTTALQLSQLFPVVSLQTLATSMQGGLLKPASTAKGDKAAKQTAALAQVEEALSAIGKDLQARADVIAKQLQTTPPVYQPLPASQLIFVHWDTLIQAWSVSLGVDLFSLVLLALACIGSDEARRQSKLPDSRPEWLVEAERTMEAARHLETTWARSREPLTSLPYPAAAQARLNGKRAPKPDQAEER